MAWKEVILNGIKGVLRVFIFWIQEIKMKSFRLNIELSKEKVSPYLQHQKLESQNVRPFWLLITTLDVKFGFYYVP